MEISLKAIDNEIRNIKETKAYFEERIKKINTLEWVRELNPDVFADSPCGTGDIQHGGWTVVYQFDNAYFRVYHVCRIRFTWYEDGKARDALETYYTDDDLVKIIGKYRDKMK